MRVDLGDDEQPEISLIALIDCIFFLLMFFMVATSFKHQADGQPLKELPITLPESAVSLDKATAAPDVVVIGVDAKGGVYWGRERVSKAVDLLWLPARCAALRSAVLALPRKSRRLLSCLVRRSKAARDW